MTSVTSAWTEEIVSVAGTTMQIVRGGVGPPLLLLHDEMGHPGWLRFHQSLSQSYALTIPSHPGFGQSPHVDWVMGMRDLATWYLRALDELNLGPVNTVGLSLGGWLAAEMAAMCPHQFRRLVLVDCPGILPPEGEIFDIFLSVPRTYITKSVLDPDGTPEFAEVCPEEPTPEQAEAWETAKEATCRVSWKPYMHDPSLPHMLSRLEGLPTLVVWGREDAIVPLSAGEVYNRSIPGSRLVVLDGCGHRPELEKSEELARLVKEFFSEG